MFLLSTNFEVDCEIRSIESALADNELQTAWDYLKGWYLNAVTEEQCTLYAARQSPGVSFPVMVEPFPICDLVPDAAEIAAAVDCLCPGKAPGPSRIVQ